MSVVPVVLVVGFVVFLLFFCCFFIFCLRGDIRRELVYKEEFFSLTLIVAYIF